MVKFSFMPREKKFFVLAEESATNMVKAAQGLKEMVDTWKNVEGKVAEITELESKLKNASEYNHRQVALLSHALRHPEAEYTIQSHRISHNTAYATARSDLTKLVEKGLLVEATSGGRNRLYRPSRDIKQKL